MYGPSENLEDPLSYWKCLKETGGWIFPLDMAVWRINFKGTILEIGRAFRRPWQKTREDENSSQERNNEDMRTEEKECGIDIFRR